MPANAVEDAIDVALQVAAALTSVGAEYFVGGSLASSLQGEPRATNDIDFVIALPAAKVSALIDALGTISRSMPTCFVTRCSTRAPRTRSTCRW